MIPIILFPTNKKGFRTHKKHESTWSNEKWNDVIFSHEK